VPRLPVDGSAGVACHIPPIERARIFEQEVRPTL
jgi:hypothetical protein